MANNWPDGGDQPLSRGEKLAMGAVGVVLVGLFVSGVLFLIVAMMGRRPSAIELAVIAAIGVALGLLWVRPWETEAPRPPRERDAP